MIFNHYRQSHLCCQINSTVRKLNKQAAMLQTAFVHHDFYAPYLTLYKSNTTPLYLVEAMTFTSLATSTTAWAALTFAISFRKKQ